MTFPATTECIEITAFGDASVLQPAIRKLAPLLPQQILIEVAYAGLNRPDIIQRQGFYPPPPGATDIPGLEASGTIVAVGDKVTTFQPGQKVCALLNGGGYSRYAVADESLCLPIPDSCSLQQAAALPETFFTVWFNLVESGELSTGDIVLIHGGSSGIGTTAIQVANRLGARVFTTAGNDQKCRLCESLGAEKAFNYREEDFGDLKSLTDNHGADIILDIVGGDYVQKNIKVAARKARLISLAFLQGSRVTVDLMPVMLKQLVVTGSTLRSQPLTEKARIAEQVKANLWPLVDSGLIEPIIDSVFPLGQAALAHQRMESSQHMGKILLDCQP
jgi:NADPH2:quinone reductase